MGFLIKVVLFGLIIYYLVKTIGGFVFRLLGGQTRPDQPQQNSKYRRDGEINIDYVPENQKRRRAASQKGKGGDYIDYEEVK